MKIARIENGAVVETRSIPDDTPFAAHKGWRLLVEGARPPLPRLCELSVTDSIDDDRVSRSFDVAWPEQSAAVAARIAEVDAIAARKRMTIVGVVSAAEMATWTTKEAEARVFADSQDVAAAPRLAAEAAARGVPLAALTEKVIEKATALWAAEAAIAGHAGALTDQLRALETVAEVCAFDVEAGWPA